MALRHAFIEAHDRFLEAAEAASDAYATDADRTEFSIALQALNLAKDNLIAGERRRLC
jgi:hypothetical protein